MIHFILFICTQQICPAPFNDRSLYFAKLSETLPMQQERMNVAAWKCARVYFIQADAHGNVTCRVQYSTICISLKPMAYISVHFQLHKPLVFLSPSFLLEQCLARAVILVHAETCQSNLLHVQVLK